jgi:K+:H+ antiporter subunit KhtT
LNERIGETALPGIGKRFDFVTESGERLSVVVRRDGRRELLVYDRTDPDACRELLRLAERDARTLAELLGVRAIDEQPAGP